MAELTLRDLPNVIYAELGTTVVSLSNSMRAEVDKEVAKVRQKVFKLLATRMVGRTRSPNLGVDTPPRWEPLSQNWKKRKGHGRFFEYKGGLRATLQSLSDVDGLLGTSYSYFSQEAQKVVKDRRTKSGYSLRSTGEQELEDFMPGLRHNIRTNRLVMADLVFQAEIAVVPFGNLTLLKDNYAVDDEIFGPGGPGAGVSTGEAPLAAVLTNYRGGHHRPFLGWYFNWFVRTQVTTAVEKGIARARARFDAAEDRRLGLDKPIKSKGGSMIPPEFFGI